MVIILQKTESEIKIVSAIMPNDSFWKQQGTQVHAFNDIPNRERKKNCVFFFAFI